MKKLLIVLFAVSVFSAPELVAQMGFDFGMNFEFMNREAPDGYKARGFGMGPYAGIIYGIPVSMSGTVNVGLNYKFDILWGAPGATWDDKLLDPIMKELAGEVYGGSTRTKVVIAKLGNDAGVIGAAMLGKIS